MAWLTTFCQPGTIGRLLCDYNRDRPGESKA
jgi:hypothetical protein